MSFLRIVDRELRVAARSRRTYRARALAAGTALIIGAGIWLLTQTPSLGALFQPGEYIFLTLGWLGMIYCLIEGARNTSDCLSSERREGTLGLLFLTDLSGWDVVLGKLAANSLNAIGCVLAALPVLSLSLLMGGVTAGEFWRACLAMPCALFFSMSAGIWISMRSRSEHKALFASAALLGALVFLPSELDDIFYFDPPYHLAILGPFHSFTCVPASVYPATAHEYWLSLAISIGMGFLFLLAAGRGIGRNWRDPDSKPGRKNAKPRAADKARHDHLRDYRSLRLDINPIYWLASRGGDRWRWFLAVLGLLAVLIIIELGRSATGEDAAEFCGSFPMLFSLAIDGILCWLACCAFQEARSNGALELLLCAPIGADEIVQGQWRALRDLLLRASAIITMSCGTALTLVWIRADEIASAQGFNMFADHHLPTLLCGGVTSITTFAALGWAGMWFGLTSRSLTQAIAKTY